MKSAFIDQRFPDGIPVPVTSVTIGKVDGEDAVTFTCFAVPNEVYKHKNFATEIALVSMCSEWLTHIVLGSLFYKDKFGDITIVSSPDGTHKMTTLWSRVPNGYRMTSSVKEEINPKKQKENIDIANTAYGNTLGSAQSSFW